MAERLSDAGMSLGELIVNRVNSDGLGGQSVEEVTELLDGRLGSSLAAKVASNLGDFDVLARRDRHTIEQLSRTLGTREPILVPYLDVEVQDLLGLAGIAEYLFA